MYDKKIKISLNIFSLMTILFYIFIPFAFGGYQYIQYIYNLISLFIPSFIIISISLFVLILINLPERESVHQRYLLIRNLTFAQISINLIIHILSVFIFAYPYYIGLILHIATILLIIKLLKAYETIPFRQKVRISKGIIIFNLVLVIISYFGITTIIYLGMFFFEVTSRKHLVISQIYSALDIFGYSYLSFISLFIIPSLIILALNVKNVDFKSRFLICQFLSFISVLFTLFSFAFTIVFSIINEFSIVYEIFLIKIVLYLTAFLGFATMLTIVAFLLITKKRKMEYQIRNS